MPNVNFDPNARYDNGPSCAGAGRVSASTVLESSGTTVYTGGTVVSVPGLGTDGVLGNANLRTGFNVAGGKRNNTGPNVAGANRIFLD